MAFELPQEIWAAFVIIIVAILIDSVLGIIKAIRRGEFDASKLPEFLAQDVFPYVGGLGVVAAAAQFLGAPFTEIFYAVGALVAVKYLADIKNKLKALFSVSG